MKKQKGRQGSYYVDPKSTEICVAKTCSRCGCVKPSDRFASYSRGKFKLQSECKDCTYLNSIEPTEDGTSVYAVESFNRRRKKYINRTREEILADREKKRPTGKKICKTCRFMLPLSDYHEKRSQPDGLQVVCKVCRLAKMAMTYSKRYETYWSSIGIELMCYLCGGPYEEIEHLIPTSHPLGLDIPSNTRPSCIQCNRGPGGKHGSPLEEYIFKVSHPTKTRAQILHEIVSAGIWPFTSTTPEEFMNSF